MLQQEFEQRVKMPVQAWEFEAINVVYNNSDLDKDEFCKMWRSMNKTRIERYNKKQAQISRINKMLEKARNLKEKLQAAFSKSGYSTPCYKVLTDKQGALLDELTNQSAFVFMNVMDASFELNKPIQRLERELGLI